MEDPEEQTHSFVIKFWLEELGEENGRGIWRGHITHVGSGNRQYLKALGEIADFIAFYLGMRRSTRLQVMQWLRRLKLSLRRKKR